LRLKNAMVVLRKAVEGEIARASAKFTSPAQHHAEASIHWRLSYRVEPQRLFAAGIEAFETELAIDGLGARVLVAHDKPDESRIAAGEGIG